MKKFFLIATNVKKYGMYSYIDNSFNNESDAIIRLQELFNEITEKYEDDILQSKLVIKEHTKQATITFKNGDRILYSIDYSIIWELEQTV